MFQDKQNCFQTKILLAFSEEVDLSPSCWYCIIVKPTIYCSNNWSSITRLTYYEMIKPLPRPQCFHFQLIIYIYIMCTADAGIVLVIKKIVTIDLRSSKSQRLCLSIRRTRPPVLCEDHRSILTTPTLRGYLR